MNNTMTQDVMTVTVVLAGLFFSFAFALLVEELIFGALFRVFFPTRPDARSEDSSGELTQTHSTRPKSTS
jgi:hypothetical protein